MDIRSSNDRCPMSILVLSGIPYTHTRTPYIMFTDLINSKHFSTYLLHMLQLKKKKLASISKVTYL